MTNASRIGFFDEGRGEPVALLHSSMSSRHQWRKLQQHIGLQYRLVGLDLSGYGETPFPTVCHSFTLDYEVRLVEQLLGRIEGSFHLVGHSYGGAVALKTALRYKDRVRSVWVHEPVLFGLLKAAGCLQEWHEICDICAALSEYIDQDRREAACRLFIDYWSGSGAWAKIPAHRKPEFTNVVSKVVLDFTALFEDPTDLSDYGELEAAVRVTSGNTGPRPARRVAELLSSVLPAGTLQIIEGVGHMAPLTHARPVNASIATHLFENPIPAF